MGKRVLKSSLIEDDSVVAFFTTKDLPLKAGEREDLIQEVENNKKLVCKGLNIPLGNLVIPQQTHSDNVEIIKETGNRKWGIEKNPLPISHSLFPYNSTDALVTDQQGTALALNFADCVPLIFYNPVKKVIAAAHAGWRGTVAKIGTKTVQKMIENFDSKPEDIIALIGPAIGKCCFDVKDDVYKQIVNSVDNKDSEVFSDNHVDLKLVNKLQLLSIGIKKIDVCEYCTSCQNELFFSYRKEKGNTARHSAVIMQK